MAISVVAFGFCLLCLILFLTLVKLKKNRLPYPPGPPADPVLGHLRIMPTENQEEVFHEWSKKYGDVIYLKVFGKSVIILSSERAATDLLEKRSANYSDRPSFPLYERYLARWILFFPLDAS